MHVDDDSVELIAAPYPSDYSGRKIHDHYNDPLPHSPLYEMNEKMERAAFSRRVHKRHVHNKIASKQRKLNRKRK